MLRTFCAAVALLLATAPLASAAQPGVYASVDFLLLSAEIPSVGFDEFFYRGAPDSAETGGSITDGLDLGLRTTIGIEDCCGFGGRFRWFTFDQDYDYTGAWENGGPIINLDGELNIDVDAFDIEATQRGDFCGWNLLGSAGLRYGSLDITNNTIDFSSIPLAVFLLPGTGVDFDGVGPTLSLAGERPIACTGLSVFAAGRTALLFGETDITTAFIPGGVVTIDDEMVNVTEIQMGLSHKRALNCSTDLNTAIFWEAQRWDSDSGALGDIGFIGLGLRTGLSY